MTRTADTDPTSVTKPRTFLTCQFLIRLDGREPDADAPESADDYREEYRQFWLRFEAWLRAEGITPNIWPSAMDWWNVRLATPFKLADAPRVAAWLEAQGVAVEDIGSLNVGTPKG